MKLWEELQEEQNRLEITGITLADGRHSFHPKFIERSELDLYLSMKEKKFKSVSNNKMCTYNWWKSSYQKNVTGLYRICLNLS